MGNDWFTSAAIYTEEEAYRWSPADWQWDADPLPTDHDMELVRRLHLMMEEAVTTVVPRLGPFGKDRRVAAIARGVRRLRAKYMH